MKLIVGLGNPGKEYENTRHNVGFMVLDSFVSDFKVEKKFEAMICKKQIHGEDVIFVKPLTFMNLSGNAVSKIVRYYHILVEDILVIQDDLDMELGTYKLKMNSSSGGHNGVKSIIQSLNTDSFLRLKVGISKVDKNQVIDYVLGRFSKSEYESIHAHFSDFQKIIFDFIEHGTEYTMQNYNKK